MTSTLPDWVPVAMAAGMGSFLLGTAHLLLPPRAGPLLRLLATAAAVSVGVGAPAFALGQAVFAPAVVALVGVAAAYHAAGVGRVRRAVAWLGAVSARTPVRAGGLAFAGVVAIAGTAVVAAFADFRHDDGMRFTAIRDELVAADDLHAATDRGRPVPLARPTTDRTPDERAPFNLLLVQAESRAGHLIQMDAGDDWSNCHGWVFAGGQGWVESGRVDDILADNGYVPVERPRPGDLAVYRTSREVTHTAVVRAVEPSGLVLVQGKWGSLGVFLHPAHRSIYGPEFGYHRSPRPGHLLVGLTSAGAARPVELSP